VTAEELAEGPHRHPELVGRYVRVLVPLNRSGDVRLSAGSAYLGIDVITPAREENFLLRLPNHWFDLPREDCWLNGRLGTDGGDFPVTLFLFPGDAMPDVPRRSQWEFVLDVRAAPQDPDLAARREKVRREHEDFLKRAESMSRDTKKDKAVRNAPAPRED
jgi:hypothetical protein